MNVADHLVAKLVAEGVEVVFTVPGEQHDPIFRALAGTEIRVVQCRHEQAAAFMAYGYARSSSRVGVYLVISGPGVLNSTAALATAYAGNIRVLCIAAEVPVPFLGRGLGVPHEIPDQLGVLSSLTGWAARIERPEETRGVLDEAFHRLNTGRPRPVAIEIPTDVMDSEAIATDPWIPPTPALIDSDAVDAARAALESARSPIIYVGSGARAAAAEILELAELLQIPVTADVGGRGILSDAHALSLALPAAHKLWPRVDLVLAVGTRLRRPFAEWGVTDLPIVRIDLDEQEIHRVAVPAAAVVGDAGTILRAMLDKLHPVPERREWLAEVADAKREIDIEIARLTPQVDFLDAMRAALPADGYFVDELTQVGYTARVAFPVLRHSTYISSTYLGALGFGYATALGVKIAHPERAVLSISGDGGFLYTAVELATAVQHGIGIVAVVFNDNSYKNVERSQRKSMAHTVGTDLHNPDFVKLAEAFGAVGASATDPDELRTEIEKGFTRTRTPTVIEVPLGEMPNPWPLIRQPRVR